MQTGIPGISADEWVDNPIYYRYVGNPNYTSNAKYRLSMNKDAACPPGHIYTIRIVIMAHTFSPRATAVPETYTETFDTSYDWFFMPDGYTPRAYGQHLRAYFYLVGDQLSSKAADNQAAIEAGAKVKTAKDAVPGRTYNVAPAPVHLRDLGSNPVVINANGGSAPANRRPDDSAAVAVSGRKIINADDEAPTANRTGPSSRPGLKVINSESDDDEPPPSPPPLKKKSPAKSHRSISD